MLLLINMLGLLLVTARQCVFETSSLVGLMVIAVVEVIMGNDVRLPVQTELLAQSTQPIWHEQ
jgi:hypothetical protein